MLLRINAATTDDSWLKRSSFLNSSGAYY
jgi:hypothetical protein